MYVGACSSIAPSSSLIYRRSRPAKETVMKDMPSNGGKACSGTVLRIAKSFPAFFPDCPSLSGLFPEQSKRWWDRHIVRGNKETRRDE